MSVRKSSGCMYMYEAAEPVVIDAQDQYHAVQGFQPNGCNDGVTFLASATGSVTDTANNGGVLRCTDAGHGLSTGQYITLTGMGDAAHVGSSRVTVIDVDTFDCDNIVYNSIGDTGTWIRGSSLTINTGHGGTYQIGYSFSMYSVANNRNVRVEVVKNVTDLDEMASERKIAVLNDLGVLSSGNLVGLVGGDTVWMQLKNTTAATDFAIEHANFSMHKL